MKANNFFRQLPYAVGLCAIALFGVSCSEGPTSPIPATEQTSTLGKIRPLPRKSDDAAPPRHSLAKGVYTDTQLMALIFQQPPLSSSALKTILLSESPLSSLVLTAVLIRDPSMPSGDLKAVLLASTPLPVGIEWAIQNTTLLGNTDFQAVMEAQAGFGDYFLGTTVSKWIIKKDGGDLWHGGHKISFPRNALTQDATASITISPSDYVQVDFGPNQSFGKAVTIVLSYKNVDLNGVSETALTIAWCDPTTGQWIDAGGTVDTVNKTITAKVWHFTKYTISAR